jgi:hypothetical protein
MLALSDLYQAALNRIELKEYDKAIDILNVAISKSDTLDVPFYLLDSALGVCYLSAEKKNIPAAIEYASKALGAAPEMPMFWGNLAYAHMMNYDPDTAIRICFNGLKVHKNDANMMIKLANSFHMSRKHFEAYEWQIKTRDVYPDDHHIHIGLGATELLMSGFKYRDLYNLGLLNYHRRTQMPEFAGFRNDFGTAKGLSRGILSDLNIYLEQGLGDAVMMIPYLQFLSDKLNIKFNIINNGKHDVAYNLYKEIHVPFNYVNRNSAINVNLMDLLHIDFPSEIGLDFNSKKFASKIINSPINEAKGRIGICWRGNPEFPNYHWRSVHFETILPYIQEHGHRLYNLQANLSNEEVDILKKYGVIVDEKIIQYTHLANVLCSLDKVVSTDTFMTHYAGVFGVQCDTLLNTFVDWRWGYEGEKCDLYPNHRLLRQEKTGKWDKVLNEAFK